MKTCLTALEARHENVNFPLQCFAMLLIFKDNERLLLFYFLLQNFDFFEKLRITLAVFGIFILEFWVLNALKLCTCLAL